MTSSEHDHDQDQRQGHAGLKHSQLQIAIGQRLHPDRPLYNMAFAFVVEATSGAGELDLELFAEAFRRAVGSSDALRTRLVELPGGGLRLAGEPLADEPGEISAPEIFDFSDRSDPKAEFLAWARERSARPLDLEGPLLDCALVDLGEAVGWYLNQHHIVTDAWSTRLLFRRVGAAYEALRAGGEPDLPRTQYYGVGVRRASGKAVEEAEAHWNARRRTARRGQELYGRAADTSSTASVRHTLELDEERTRAVHSLAGADGFVSLSAELSRFAVFATLLSAFLHRVGGDGFGPEHDVDFDAPVLGRPTATAKETLGLFIEMFPFAVRVGAGDSFRTLGARCLEEAKLFLRHGLPGLSGPSSSGGGRAVLNYVPVTLGDFAGRPTDVEWLHPGHGDGVHALRLQVHDFAGRGRTTLHFDVDEALPERIRRRIPGHFEALLDALLADPDHAVDSVDLRTDEERLELAKLNETWSRPWPERTIVEAFESVVADHGDRTALRLIEAGEAAGELSFSELKRQADAVGGWLAAGGVGRGDRVAVSGRRSVESVVAILGALRAGAAYVPIDLSYPPARRRHILEDSGARLLLDDDRVREALEAQKAPTAARPDPSDLAYVLYTSGSTGGPKGVLVDHRGLADYVDWASRRYVRGERMTYPLFTSLSFDLTVTSLFLPLVTGGTLEIYPQPEGPVDSALLDVAARNGVDFLKLTPSHLTLLRRRGLEGSKVRRLIVGGEDLPAELASAVAAQLGPDAEIYNEYGPTEAVVGCVVHRFDPQRDVASSVPIGAPADHVEVQIRNRAGVAVAEGVPGELWLGGRLARGYHRLEEQTAERFVIEAEDDAAPVPGLERGRRYRTGDLVRLKDAATLEFLGRIDRQAKISGFRVEPAEIEAVLRTLPGIAHCAVVVRRRRQADPVAEAVADRAAVGAKKAEPVRHCVRCGLPSNYPRATFDDEGVCSLCRSYESIREYAQSYFRTLDDLEAIFEQSRRQHRPKYDCMMLYSGGKDSTYALCRLAEMGLSIYAFTLDNGFISGGAKSNIRRVTDQLGVAVEFATTPAMNAIFRDSLARFSNVCNGCFKTIYTLAMQRARELGIPIIATGLSRGQMFETRLTEDMFRGGRVGAEEVDAAVLASRKAYHRTPDEVSRSLDVSMFESDHIFDQIRFVDFYRYCDVGMDELYAYLRRKVPWVRPEDTGRSTNCLINDAGIFVHKRERGFHNYALPYSWEVRLGHKTREEALDELDDEIDERQVREILEEVGYEERAVDAGTASATLEAFYVADEEVTDLGEQALRDRLGEELPAPMVPTRLVRVDEIPLTVRGKIDESALLARDLDDEARRERPSRQYCPPEGPVEEFLAELWRSELAARRVGRDDSFFELGGTSLTAMRVMLRLCEEFDIDVPLETAFTHPTLRGQARVAEDVILADSEALG